MRTFFISFFIVIFAPLIAEQELVVEVGTSASLSPLCLAPFEKAQAELDNNYLDQLEKILWFDLNYNGFSTVTQKTPAMLKQIEQEKGWKTFDPIAWKQLRLSTVVKVQIAHKQLSAACFIVSKNGIKGIEGITLTGNLNVDRRKIHEVADAICESAFGKKGIASSQVLYTVRKRAGDNSNQWQTDVWEMDYDGANARQITHDGFLCVTPAYLPLKKPGSRSFLYVSYKIGQPKIFMASTEGGTPKRMTLLRGNQLMPAIAPTLDCMAFVSDITGNPELFIQSYSPERGLVGQPRQVYSAPQGAQASPTFSPDGKKIAFVSNKDGSARIYMLPIPQAGQSIKTLNPTLISKRNPDNTCPAWSPDGKMIAYSSLTKGVRQIWIYDFTTRKETQLTDGPGHKENPSWAPNSLHLLFNSSTATSSEVFLINLNQKEAVKVGQSAGEKRFPIWEG